MSLNQNIEPFYFLAANDAQISLCQSQSRFSIDNENRSWVKYNWGRAVAFQKMACKDTTSGPITSHITPPAISNLDSVIARRSRRFFQKKALDNGKAQAICRFAGEQIIKCPWMQIFCIHIRVEGSAKGIYELCDGDLKLVCNCSEKGLLQCLHGMWWIGGSGLAFIFVLNVPDAADALGHTSFSYIRALRDIGRVAQSILVEGGAKGLGGWMTPALHESNTCLFLNIKDAEREPVYFLRLGIPDERVWEYEK